MHQRLPLPSTLPSGTSDEVRKFEMEIARLSEILKRTPADQKRLLSETRQAIRDLELKLKVERENLANSPAAYLDRKVAELDAARTELARLERSHPADKKLLGAARAKLWELEALVKDMRRRTIP